MSSSSETFLMECIADSMPAFTPEQACKGPAVVIMSSLITPIISLPFRRLRTSSTPIGLTPGLPSFVSPLSSGISLHAINSAKQLGFTSSEHQTFATSAIASHRCNEAFPNAFEPRKSFHMSQSMIDGPPEQLKFLFFWHCLSNDLFKYHGLNLRC